MKKQFFLNDRLCVLVIMLIGLIIYSNTTDVPFYFDDLNNIEQNTAIHLDKITPETLYQAAFKGHIRNRPVANLSLAFNYYFGQTNVEGYHWVNMIIHILNGICVFYLIRLTLITPAIMGKCRYPTTIALVSALLWLVHPLQTQSVTYIIQRMNSMCALFYLISFLFFIKRITLEGIFVRSFFLFGAIIFWILALGSKEIAVTLPFFVVLYYWFFYQDLSSDWIKKGFIYFFFPVMIAVLVALLYLGSSPIENALRGFGGRDFSLGERLLTEFRVVVHYINLALYPHPSRLHLDYDFPVSVSLINPISTLLSIFCVAILFVLSIKYARKYRVLSFAIIWFFGNLLLESSFIPLEIIYEHRTYLPLVFVSAVPIMYLANSLNHLSLSIVSICIVLLFGLWTYERNNFWRDPIKFWINDIENASTKARPYSELGMVYGKKGDLNNAELFFKKALTVDPHFFDALNNLGTVSAMYGDFDSAATYYKKAVSLKPYKGMAQLNLGRVLLMQKNEGEALSHLQKAAQLLPGNTAAMFILGRAYLQNKNFDLARQSFSVILERDNNNMTVHKYYDYAIKKIVPRESD